MQAFRNNRPFKILFVSDSRSLYGKTLNSLRAQLGVRFMLHPFSDTDSALWNLRTSAYSYDLLLVDSAMMKDDAESSDDDFTQILAEVPGMLLLLEGEDTLAHRAIDLGFNGFCFLEPDGQFRRLLPALALRMMTDFRELHAAPRLIERDFAKPDPSQARAPAPQVFMVPS